MVKENDFVHFEIAVIGSSPTCLIEALAQAISGKKVILVDMKSKIGGSWSVSEHFGLSNVEVGCHVLLHRESDIHSGYKFLQEASRIPLESMNPQPQYAVDNLFTSTMETPWSQMMIEFYSLKKYSASSLKALFMTFLNLCSLNKRDATKNFAFFKTKFVWQIISLAKQVLKHFLMRGRFQNWDYKYPKHGTYDMLDRLTSDMIANDVEINLNTELHQVMVKDSKEIILKCDNKTVSCDEFIMSSGARIDFIFHETGKPVRIPFEGKKACHFFLLIEDKSRRKFSFVQFFDYLDVQLVSDITPYTYPKEKLVGKKLLVFRVENETEKYTRDELKRYGAHLLNFVKSKKLIGDQATLLECDQSAYYASYRNHDVWVKAQSNLPKNIRMLYTTNFMTSICDNVSRWNQLMSTLKSNK